MSLFDTLMYLALYWNDSKNTEKKKKRMKYYYFIAYSL